jgi:hypothetical protein
MPVLLDGVDAFGLEGRDDRQRHAFERDQPVGRVLRLVRFGELRKAEAADQFEQRIDGKGAEREGHCRACAVRLRRIVDDERERNSEKEAQRVPVDVGNVE